MNKPLIALIIATAVTAGFASLPAGQAHAATSDAVIVSGVNLRAQPSVSARSYGLLKAGETITILSQANSYWYQVRDSQGRTGYVSANNKYIQSSSGMNGGSTAGNNSSSSGSRSAVTDVNSMSSRIIRAGKAYLGTPYEFGSDRSNTRTFDCSDFVKQAFQDGAGITLPSDSRSQGAYVRSLGHTTTNWRNLQPGDVMFFMAYKGTSASAYPSDTSGQPIAHVGIYLGNGQILHTYSKDSGGVRIDQIAGKHWESRFIFGGSAIS
ncbi:hypothetical protein PAESOLCIP111_03654 [Paenibacillus solanacearum]|uniref:Hydrolase Nlp/P60 n=1 Tax=Paenibacillus solanacearum TaxID=2048548 RepID=A0A916K5Q5_9BACL|nr:SH3 domain-containing C40 family peptidase [Paenibacillus solanacearum]CAG7635351.1 hypothetical protein PAESOLCIP111_03654 [Paenibacillus solanacearum]